MATSARQATSVSAYQNGLRPAFTRPSTLATGARKEFTNDGFGKNTKIEQKRKILDIGNVVFDPGHSSVGRLDLAAQSIGLGPSGYARSHRVTCAIMGDQHPIRCTCCLHVDRVRSSITVAFSVDI